ncbi:stage IV sporulation protein B [[Clostridium] sordellii]|uniref:Stage IV sporulation protein B, peptidase S55 family n=1 Tax=Paraclostridium sordellii TaxID=1505 RepID=A0ABM9RMZ6_PARSO|nr:SpoIVB peptidase S55 domain-containing protein [Paeniclostridium sordellii]CEJ73406.1 Stage IV sporulation protein B, peptidase S55 family [[Clostridium] sordellii] [Paeniclostridium sordellii]CEN68958.1 stage IV sporulation protein B [[Clostridium] sordellii] [Paeniclostridium sordellii]CEN72225.1 stage IV sporulation protein B [[Clostridium] sordellii] [Paeniclostridium sordellii]CEO23450.1 stage IV sporulation protein B [[Clostridium] sordellii] [Paeniclostridium sordellii]CEP76182.1 sta
MKNFKTIIITAIIAILLPTNICFSQEKVEKLMPSAEVVFVNLNLKFPIVQSKLSKDSDFEEDDVILSVISLSKKKVYDLNDLTELYKQEDEKVLVRFIRDKKENSQVFTATDFRGIYLSFVQQFCGTITAIKEDGSFVGLSHNIEGSEAAQSTQVYETSYVHSIKAKLFNSGGLKPHIKEGKDGKLNYMGDIEGYSDYGVHGKLKENKFNSNKAMEIGRPKKGTAYIYCKSPITNEKKLHEIEIVKVYKDGAKIKVKDKELKEYRGGVIGGMSGSPIIQDNKLVGGVRSSYIYNHKVGFISNIDYMLNPNLSSK